MKQAISRVATGELTALPRQIGALEYGEVASLNVELIGQDVGATGELNRLRQRYAAAANGPPPEL